LSVFLSAFDVYLLPIGFETGIVNYAYYIWIDAEFIGEGFFDVFVFIHTSVEKLIAKRYKVVSPKKANSDHYD
tara:strand:+ start:255 stop:473 length:219 start_codon:yes stop_codon:yes gene_type:complete